MTCLLSMSLDLAYHLTLAWCSLDCWLNQLSPLSLLCSPCPGPCLCWQRWSLVPSSLVGQSSPPLGAPHSQRRGGLRGLGLNGAVGPVGKELWAEARVRLVGAISACWHAQGSNTSSFPSQSSNKALMSSHISFKVIYWAVSNELYATALPLLG